MIKAIFIILLFIIKSSFGQTESKSTLYEISFPRFLISLEDSTITIANDTILTEIDSLDNRKYGNYYFKKVDIPVLYTENNYSNIKSYFWISHIEHESENEDEESIITFKIGHFIKSKKRLFSKRQIKGYAVYDGRNSYMFIYSYDNKSETWNYEGRIR